MLAANPECNRSCICWATLNRIISCLRTFLLTLHCQGTHFRLGKTLTVLSTWPTHLLLNGFPFAVIIIFTGCTSALLCTSNTSNIAFCKWGDQRCPSVQPSSFPWQPEGDSQNYKWSLKAGRLLWSIPQLCYQNCSSCPGKLSRMKSAEKNVRVDLIKILLRNTVCTINKKLWRGSQGFWAVICVKGASTKCEIQAFQRGHWDSPP